MRATAATLREARSLDALLDSAPERTETDESALDPRLHGYQRRAVRHLHEHPRAALFLEMGLGKTATVLQALTADHLPALVVSTKRAAELTWPTEAETWRPDLSVQVAKGAPAKRARALSSDADLVVVGRDVLHTVADLLGKDHKFRTVVLDELTSFKTPSSRRFKAARRLCSQVPYVWGLTGTPVPGGYADLWGQLALIDRGARLGRTLGQFRERYLRADFKLSSGAVGSWSLRPGAKERIDSALADVCLSMTAADYLQLPPRTDNTVQVRLPPAAAKVYRELERDLVANLGTGTYTAKDAAQATNRLQQVSAGFLYPDTEEPEAGTARLHTEKVQAVAEVVEGTGSPVLVLYAFRWERDELLRALPGARAADDGDAVSEFAAGRLPVLVAHPASIGHGLNFQHASHTVVWASLPWSSELYDQANDRVDRQGQTHPVVVHHVQTEPGVDARMLQALQGKIDVQDSLLKALRGKR